jgi:flagellar hook-basal body complex protein FliE
VSQSLEAKLNTAEEKRTAQLKEVKEKLGEHMDKIEKAQKELEMQIEVRLIFPW